MPYAARCSFCQLKRVEVTYSCLQSLQLAALLLQLLLQSLTLAFDFLHLYHRNNQS